MLVLQSVSEVAYEGLILDTPFLTPRQLSRNRASKSSYALDSIRSVRLRGGQIIRSTTKPRSAFLLRTFASTDLNAYLMVLIAIRGAWQTREHGRNGAALSGIGCVGTRG